MSKEFDNNYELVGKASVVEGVALLVEGTVDDGSVSAFDPLPNLLMKQTPRGWIQNILGCEAPTEIKIATIEQRDHDIFYAFEDSSCCLRLFLPSHHPFQMHISTGAAQGGNRVASFERPCALNIHPCKCCLYQEIRAFDAHGTSLGTFQETFWCCVPRFSSLRPDKSIEYDVHIPLICGCLPNYCAEGCCRCRVPFYIFHPGGDGTAESHIGKIIKIWGGFGMEFVGAHQFEVQFPAHADAAAKARLVGGTLLLNELFFKRHKHSR